MFQPDSILQRKTDLLIEEIDNEEGGDDLPDFEGDTKTSYSSTLSSVISSSNGSTEGDFSTTFSDQVNYSKPIPFSAPKNNVVPSDKTELSKKIPLKSEIQNRDRLAISTNITRSINLQSMITKSSNILPSRAPLQDLKIPTCHSQIEKNTFETQSSSLLSMPSEKNRASFDNLNDPSFFSSLKPGYSSLSEIPTHFGSSALGKFVTKIKNTPESPTQSLAPNSLMYDRNDFPIGKPSRYFPPTQQYIPPSSPFKPFQRQTPFNPRMMNTIREQISFSAENFGEENRTDTSFTEYYRAPVGFSGMDPHFAASSIGYQSSHISSENAYRSNPAPYDDSFATSSFSSAPFPLGGGSRQLPSCHTSHTSQIGRFCPGLNIPIHLSFLHINSIWLYIECGLQLRR